MTNEIFEEIANFNQSGSGWVFKKIVSLDIFTVDYVPLRGSSYIPLPSVLTKKKAIINLKNKDDQCFVGIFVLFVYVVVSSYLF